MRPKKKYTLFFTICVLTLFVNQNVLASEQAAREIVIAQELDALSACSAYPKTLDWSDICYQGAPTRIESQTLLAFKNERDSWQPNPSGMPDADQYREYFKNTKSQEKDREAIIEKTLDDALFKISAGYMFLRGEQSFRLDHPDVDGNLSKLTYPIRGGLAFVRGEVKVTPRIFIGGRFASSNFTKETSKDEDWNFPDDHNGVPTLINYQITEQDAENEADFWNINLYYRALDWEQASTEEWTRLFIADRISLDAFAGYQYYRGRHTMIDPITKWERLIGDQWWYVPSVPLYLGLNSWYEVVYKGPRIGARINAGRGDRLSSSLSLAYAWLTTDANAYWNLRDFRWHHEGKGLGSSVSIDLETEYQLTSHWFVGGGVHWMWQRHKKSLYSGTQPGYDDFNDLDLARDTNMNLVGVSLQTGFRW